MANSLKKLIESGLVWRPEEACYSQRPLAGERNQYTTSITAARFGIASIDSALPHGGLSIGGIHEFFVGFLEPIHYLPAPPLGILSQIVANALSIDSSLALWIGRNCWPSPFALQALDASQHAILKHCVFIDPPSHQLNLWATEAALRHGGIRIVISTVRSPSFTTTRRLSLAAARGKSVGILIRNFKEQDSPSTAQTRWLISPIPSALFPELPCGQGASRWQVTLLNCKGPRPAQSCWIVEDKGGRYEESEQPLSAQSTTSTTATNTNKKYAVA